MTESHPEKLVFKDSERESGLVLATYLQEVLGVELPHMHLWDDVLDATAEQLVHFAEDLLADQPWEEPTVAVMKSKLSRKKQAHLRAEHPHRVRQWESSRESNGGQAYAIKQFAVPNSKDKSTLAALPFYLFQLRYQLPSAGDHEHAVATYVVDLDPLPLPDQPILDRLDMPGGRSPEAGPLLADMLEAYREPRAAHWLFRPYRFGQTSVEAGTLPVGLAERFYRLLLDERLAPFVVADKDNMIMRMRDNETQEQFGIVCDDVSVHVEHLTEGKKGVSGVLGDLNFRYNSCLAWRRIAPYGQSRTLFDREAFELFDTAVVRLEERLGVAAFTPPTAEQSRAFGNSDLRSGKSTRKVR